MTLPALPPTLFTPAEAATLRTALAPQGTLRACINLGNPILAGLDAAGAPCGVSVDLATALAQRLDVALQPVVVPAAGLSVETVRAEQADVGFFAIDPQRGEGIAFTAPYVLIEGCYLVRADSPLQDNAEVDAPGRTVVVGLGSAYDLYLSRALTQATVRRAPTSPAVVAHFLAEGAEVAAGVKQQLQADAAAAAAATPPQALRLLPGRFMVIQQAMGCPRSRGAAAATLLARFVEAAKASGFVAAALARHGIQGAGVAPAAGTA
ncbi:transporter substrate-binding domain-containing protein [Ideonella livida]|uniref:Transporter substrate-binding domain-containing protein n=1 Tax=Ideonella livida TaxID=2707176 RepID=A0A7C9PJ02_9BURK|nr:transporter substrate-binding domain-containing protein [Ideonella livida]NDY93217.1 transporter substrate-binding domain-containing protein [Ideonella livida]